MDRCCFCADEKNLTNILQCEHKLCAECVRASSGDVKCPECPTDQRPAVSSSAGSKESRPDALDGALMTSLQEVPQLQKKLRMLIANLRREQRTNELEKNDLSRKINESSVMAVKNVNHRAQKLMEQVDETEEKRKLGIFSLMNETDDNKGTPRMICLLAMALADSDSDDFATVALGDELIGALTTLQAQPLQLEFDDDISGLGLEFAERPQDASVGTLVRKQNCIGIATLDNGEFLLAVDQRSNGGVCLGRAKKDETDDVRWVLAFQPLDVVAPVILGSFSATKSDKEQNNFLAVGREVFSVNIDRLFSKSTVASSTSVRNYRLNFLHKDARITAIDWYPENADYVIIADDKSEVLHVVDVKSSSVKREIKPQVAFTAANAVMTLTSQVGIQIAIASEASKTAAMLSVDGSVNFYFKKPSECGQGHPPTACLPRTLFLSCVTELLIFRRSKIGVMWVDEKKGARPVYVLYDTDDGTWRRTFEIEDKTPVGVTYIPPGELAFCFSSARVKVCGFKD